MQRKSQSLYYHRTTSVDEMPAIRAGVGKFSSIYFLKSMIRPVKNEGLHFLMKTCCWLMRRGNMEGMI